MICAVYEEFFNNLLEKSESMLYSGIPLLISTPLLFYGFRLIQTAEIPYFRKLSKLNLYLLIIGAPWSVLYIPTVSGFMLKSGMVTLLSMLVLTLAFFVTIALRWYWEIKLFRHLSRKFSQK